MPGIMPMKIIKVGSSSQSRVAQACDRCRSKKIRCDGITPCCTQCANVGFECKTSDKLSRRAFPRGYTESLEERVRQLEAEVRDLKVLLDEKDEKIDLLSKFHNFSTQRRKPGTPGIAKNAGHNERQQAEAEEEAKGQDKKDGAEADETFAIKQPSSLTKTSSRTEPHWAGASSSTSFLDVFKEKAAASGRAVPAISPRALFPGKGLASRRPMGGHARRPPRLVSDRLVNVYLQEFAPLFPILYRPAFLEKYREFSEGSDNIENHHAVAQLNLVFSIASAASCDPGDDHGTAAAAAAAFDNHWQSALNAVVHDNSLATLQCLVLAQLCCLCKGDSNRVLHYAGLAIIMSRRLGLHKLQAGLLLDPLTTELRKRAFWCLYTLDTFTAAHLGLPRLIKDEVVQTEMPLDLDDEDLMERRSAAGGSNGTRETKMSTSLALFALARIFARVVDQVYQAPSVSGVSLQIVAGLTEALDDWRDALSPHLRLTFSQDKPSTRVTGDRSPLLSLAYYHVRALLHRPLATSDLGSKAMPSALILADSSKHMVQIVQLLEERRMSFALPLSRNEVLITAGLGLLYQGFTIPKKTCDGSLAQGSSIVSDNQRLVCAIMSILDASSAPSASEFKALACSLIAVDGFRICRSPSMPQNSSVSPRSSISQVSAAHSSSDTLVSSNGDNSPVVRQGSAESFAYSPKQNRPATIAQRRAVATIPGQIQFSQGMALSMAHQSHLYKGGLTPIKSEPALRAAIAAQQAHQQMLDKRSSMMPPTGQLRSLDYLPMGSGSSSVHSLTPAAQKQNVFDSGTGAAHWEHLLGYLGGAPVLGDPSIGGSPPVDIFSPEHSAFDGSIGIPLGNIDWVGQDPVSATAWTGSTGVPSVFDDSGASLTSGDDGRSSVDMGRDPSAELQREIDYLAGASGVDLDNGLTNEFVGLQNLEIGIQI